ncbi:MAG TPA: hypothetical protein VKB48_04270 [Candidatus Acidoferrum sp.]|nr:hypothetical protein [Candidatus Acidoferrum sp.]
MREASPSQTGRNEQKGPQAGGSTNWFARGALPLDSGEVKTHHELFVLLNKIYDKRTLPVGRILLKNRPFECF